MFEKIYKRCPRCEEKNIANAYKCISCGLVFDRMKFATNKAGKKMLKQGQKDKVVWVKQYPEDVQRYKVLLFCIFLGMWGAHCYYVGRIAKGILMSIWGAITIIGGLLLVWSLIPQQIYLTSQIIIGIPVFMWLWDLSAIIFKKFKVPVSIDFLEEK